MKRYIEEDGRYYEVDDTVASDKYADAIAEFQTIAGELAVQEKENDWWKVTNAARRIVDDIMRDDDLDKKQKVVAVNKIIDEMPTLLKKSVKAVIQSMFSEEEWQVFAKQAVLKDMMVFREGTHNGHKITAEMVTALKDNFNSLKGVIRPKLKITHREDQEKVAGLASYGDIFKAHTKKVKNSKTGKVLMHLFVSVKNVPKQVAEWINDRRFAERSIEFWPQIKVNGKIVKNVLRNVSMLGHEAPAVPGMEPIIANSDEVPEAAEFEFQTVSLAFDGDDESIEVVFEDFDEYEETEDPHAEGGDITMGKTDVTEDIKKLQDTITQLSSDVEAKDVEIASMKNESDVEGLKAEKIKLEERLATATDQAAKFEDLQKEVEEGRKAIEESTKMKADVRKNEIDSKIEAWKSEKMQHIAPADESVARALLESFSDDKIKLNLTDADGGADKEVEMSQAELLDVLVSRKSHQAFGEVSPAGKVDVDTSGAGDVAMNAGAAGELGEQLTFAEGANIGQTMDVAGSDLDAKAKALMAKYEGMSYEDAIINASR